MKSSVANMMHLANKSGKFKINFFEPFRSLIVFLELRIYSCKTGWWFCAVWRFKIMGVNKTLGDQNTLIISKEEGGHNISKHSSYTYILFPHICIDNFLQNNMDTLSKYFAFKEKVWGSCKRKIMSPKLKN